MYLRSTFILFRRVLALCPLLVAAVPIGAQAADFYIYGAGFERWPTVKDDDLDISVDIDDARGGALALGWDFAAGTVLEILLDGSKGESADNGLDVESAAVSLNFYYEPRLDFFQPRLGIGIGAEAFEVDDNDFDTETGGMAQASGGFMLWLGSHFALGPTYRYRYSKEQVAELEDACTISHIVEVGAKVSF